MRLLFPSSYLSHEQGFPSPNFVYSKWFVRFACKCNDKQNTLYLNAVMSHINKLYVVDFTNYVRSHS